MKNIMKTMFAISLLLTVLDVQASEAGKKRSRGDSHQNEVNDLNQKLFTVRTACFRLSSEKAGLAKRLAQAEEELRKQKEQHDRELAAVTKVLLEEQKRREELVAAYRWLQDARERSERAAVRIVYSNESRAAAARLQQTR